MAQCRCGAVVNAGIRKPVIIWGWLEAQYGTKMESRVNRTCKDVRLNEYNAFKNLFDRQYLDQIAQGNPYSEEDIQKSL